MKKSTMLIAAVLGQALAVPLAASPLPAADAPETLRLRHAMACLRSGESLCIAAVGGSITTGFAANPPEENGWAAQTAEWFEDRARDYGGSVQFVNAGLSGTDSAWGTVRLQEQVLDHWPDVVFVEFAINDQWLSPAVRGRSYEGVLRQLLDDSERALVLVAINEKAAPQKSQRREQEAIGKHYDLPTLAWADMAGPNAAWGSWFDGAEAIHPNTSGHTAIADGIRSWLDEVWASLPDDTAALPAVDTALPAPRSSDEFARVRWLGADNAKVIENTGFTPGADIHGEWTRRGGLAPRGWMTADETALLRVAVEGQSVGVTIAESDQYRNAEAWIDFADGTSSRKIPLNTFVSFRSGYLGWAYVELARDMPEGEHVLNIRLKKGRATEKGRRSGITGIVLTGLSR